MFREAAATCGWTVYPETSGWDMIAIKKDTSDGEISIGIQAKLKYCFRVLEQVLENRSQVHYRAIVVPYIDDKSIAMALGIVPISMCDGNMMGIVSDYGKFSETHGLSFFTPVDTPAWLPDICPEWEPAGVPGPRTINRWTQDAIKFLAESELSGVTTTSLFKKFKMTPSTWIKLGWAKKIRKDGRGWIYQLCNSGYAARPDVKHPEYYAKMFQKIKEERTKNERCEECPRMQSITTA